MFDAYRALELILGEEGKHATCMMTHAAIQYIPLNTVSSDVKQSQMQQLYSQSLTNIPSLLQLSVCKATSFAACTTSGRVQ